MLKDGTQGDGRANALTSRQEYSPAIFSQAVSYSTHHCQILAGQHSDLVSDLSIAVEGFLL